MPRKINAKLILKLLHDGYSYREINTMACASNRSVKAVIDRARELPLSYEDASDMSEEDVYRLLFPERYPDPDMYYLEDYDYVHKELDKPWVTLKLLWQEYQRRCLPARWLPLIPSIALITPSLSTHTNIPVILNTSLQIRLKLTGQAKRCPLWTVLRVKGQRYICLFPVSPTVRMFTLNRL